MQDNWTTVATFSWYQDALLLKMRLEASGIDCIIPEQYTSTINPGTTGMTVRVLVKGAQFVEAKTLIETVPLASEPETCPKCDSENIEPVSKPKTNFFRFLLGVLLFFPMRRKTAKHCKSCGAQFP